MRKVISNEEKAKQLVEAFLSYEDEDTEWMIDSLALELKTSEIIGYNRGLKDGELFSKCKCGCPGSGQEFMCWAEAGGTADDSPGKCECSCHGQSG